MRMPWNYSKNTYVFIKYNFFNSWFSNSGYHMLNKLMICHIAKICSAAFYPLIKIAYGDYIKKNKIPDLIFDEFHPKTSDISIDKYILHLHKKQFFTLVMFNYEPFKKWGIMFYDCFFILYYYIGYFYAPTLWHSNFINRYIKLKL